MNLAFCLLLFFTIVGAPLPQGAPPSLETICDTSADLDAAVKGYHVRVTATVKRRLLPIDRNEYVDQVAVLDMKADRLGRIRAAGKITTSNQGKKTVDTVTRVFDGEKVKLVDGEGGAATGRITKGLPAVYILGIDPREFLTHVEHAPLKLAIKEYEIKPIGSQLWHGRELTALQTKVNDSDGQQFCGLIYLDPSRHYSIARVAYRYRTPPDVDWTEFKRLEVVEAHQDLSGVWLPTKATVEEYTVQARRGVPPELMVKSDIVFTDWVLNPNLPESTFAFQFPVNSIMTDEIAGKTFKSVAITDQDIADSANLLELAPANGTQARGLSLFIGLGLTLSLIGLFLVRRYRR